MAEQTRGPNSQSQQSQSHQLRSVASRERSTSHWPYLDSEGQMTLTVYLPNYLRPSIFGYNRNKIDMVEAFFHGSITFESDATVRGPLFPMWVQAKQEEHSRNVSREVGMAAYAYLQDFEESARLLQSTGGRGPYFDEHYLEYREPSYKSLTKKAEEEAASQAMNRSADLATFTSSTTNVDSTTADPFKPAPDVNASNTNVHGPPYPLLPTPEAPRNATSDASAIEVSQDESSLKVARQKRAAELSLERINQLKSQLNNKRRRVHSDTPEQDTSCKDGEADLEGRITKKLNFQHEQEKKDLEEKLRKEYEAKFLLPQSNSSTTANGQAEAREE